MKTDRLADARSRAAGCMCLAGTLKSKLRIATLSVLPKASWPALVDVQVMESVFKRVHRKQQQASPFLFRIFRGRRWDLRSSAVCEVCSVLHRLLVREGCELPGWGRTKSGWIGALRKGLK